MSPLSANVMAVKFLSLLSRAESIEVSYKRAVKLIGGEKRLERLMVEEKVRYSKPPGAVNTMWRFNLADIMLNVKPTKNSLQLSEYGL